MPQITNKGGNIMYETIFAGSPSNRGLSLNFLTDDDIERIHEASMSVLQRCGVYVEEAEARKHFADAGAWVDEKEEIVRLPQGLVERCVKTTPATFHATGRIKESDRTLGGNRINFTNFGEGIYMVDIDTGEVRPSTKQDVKDVAKVVDACEHYGVYERAINPTDIAAPVAPLHNFEGSVLNTSKHHLIGPVTTLNAQAMIDCAAAIQGGYDKLKKRPLLSFTLSPISPLKLVDHVTKIARLAGKYGVPCNFINMAMAGGTTPVQLAGTMVCHNAELLAAVCYTQIMNEGAPLIYGTSTTGMDLRKANACVGTPELALIGASHAQLAKFYKFPCLCAGG